MEKQKTHALIIKNNPMGMRRNISFQYKDDEKPSIYLYTHWGAKGMEEELAKSLNRGRDRWGDESYLARIIITDITQYAGNELTGYGISPYEIDPEFETLAVNLEKQTVNEVPYEKFIDNPEIFKI